MAPVTRSSLRSVKQEPSTFIDKLKDVKRYVLKNRLFLLDFYIIMCIIVIIMFQIYCYYYVPNLCVKYREKNIIGDCTEYIIYYV